MNMINNRPNILPQDGIALYYEKIVNDEEIKGLYDALLNNIHWENERVIMFGKEIVTKRKVAFSVTPPFPTAMLAKLK